MWLDVGLFFLIVVAIGFCIHLSSKLNILNKYTKNLSPALEKISQVIQKSANSIGILKVISDSATDGINTYLPKSQAMRDDLKMLTQYAQNLSIKLENILEKAEIVEQNLKNSLLISLREEESRYQYRIDEINEIKQSQELADTNKALEQNNINSQNFAIDNANDIKTHNNAHNASDKMKDLSSKHFDNKNEKMDFNSFFDDKYPEDKYIVDKKHYDGFARPYPNYKSNNYFNKILSTFNKQSSKDAIIVKDLEKNRTDKIDKKNEETEFKQLIPKESSIDQNIEKQVNTVGTSIKRRPDTIFSKIDIDENNPNKFIIHNELNI